jgi:hypothetical protein
MRLRITQLLRHIAQSARWFQFMIAMVIIAVSAASAIKFLTIDQEAIMAHYRFEHDPKWQPRKGLEGPFFYANGRVLYYDTKAGQYWDPTTDFYVENDELHMLQQDMVNLLRKTA